MANVPRDPRARHGGIGLSFQKAIAERNPAALMKGLVRVVRQRRSLEVLYGLYCFLAYRPSRFEIIAREDTPMEEISEHREYCRRIDAENHFDFDFPIRRGSLFDCSDDYLVAGQYADYGKRLAARNLKTGNVFTSRFYDRFDRVRHIHLVHHLRDNLFLVATGDSLKRLDQFEVTNDELTFRSRVIRYFGGFTASCRSGGKNYFGSDFSNRPNYLYRLEDRAVFPLPRPCYTFFITEMVTLKSGNIYVRCKKLKTKLACELIFDVTNETFFVIE